MLGQTFSKCFLVLDYQWNKDYIAKWLCVNRDRPAMKCEGKCYLCKKLKADAKKDQENPERRMENRTELISYWTAWQLIHPASIAVRSQYPLFAERVSVRCANPFFHPPQV